MRTQKIVENKIKRLEKKIIEVQISKDNTNPNSIAGGLFYFDCTSYIKELQFEIEILKWVLN